MNRLLASFSVTRECPGFDSIGANDLFMDGYCGDFGIETDRPKRPFGDPTIDVSIYCTLTPPVRQNSLGGDQFQKFWSTTKRTKEF
jgi:hypothetical protein